MTQEALKLALKALEDARAALAYIAVGNAETNPRLAKSTCKHGVHAIDKVVPDIKEALAQTQEPPKYSFKAHWEKDGRIGIAGVVMRPDGGPHVLQVTIDPPQPEQELVGDDWTPCIKLPVVVYVRKQRLGESHVSTREGITPVKPDDLIMRGVSGEEYPIGRAIFEQTYSLNTAPPQRTWVGLAAEDRLTAKYMQDAPDGIEAVIDYIEAKLKEKNT